MGDVRLSADTTLSVRAHGAFSQDHLLFSHVASALGETGELIVSQAPPRAITVCSLRLLADAVDTHGDAAITTFLEKLELKGTDVASFRLFCDNLVDTVPRLDWRRSPFKNRRYEVPAVLLDSLRHSGRYGTEQHREFTLRRLPTLRPTVKNRFTPAPSLPKARRSTTAVAKASAFEQQVLAPVTWKEFSETKEARDAMAKHGQAAVQKVFAAFADGNAAEGVSISDLQAFAAKSGALGNALVTTVWQCARVCVLDLMARRLDQLVEDGPRELLLRRQLASAGFNHVVAITGESGPPGRPPNVTELTLLNASADELPRLHTSTDAKRAFMAAFGTLDSEPSFAYDAERRCIVVTRACPATQGAAPGATPSLRSAHTDFITHHNQALDAWAWAKGQGLLRGGNVLIHVDSHSDLYIPAGQGAGVADYLNSAIADGTVAEMYWVVPDELPIVPPPFDLTKGLPRYKGTPYDVVAWVRDGKTQLAVPPEREQATYRRVAIHVVTLSQLPTQKLRHQKNLVLNIDIDYFAPSGYDTAKQWRKNPSRGERENALHAFTSTLSALSFAFTTVCRSPAHTVQDDQGPLLEFFKSSAHDAIPNKPKSYRHGSGTIRNRVVLQLISTQVIATEFRVYSDALFQHLLQRGYEELAHAYRAYCQDHTGIDELKAAYRRAASDARIVVS